MTKNYNNISNEAVKYATGKEWDEWFSLLDEKDAEKLSHKEIADLLLCGGYIEKGNGWWAQSVTVAYEYAKGRRVKGQTADGKFKVGVQKTLPINVKKLWQFIIGSKGLSIWLGNGLEELEFEKNSTYQTNNGTTGEIRSFYPHKRLRLTWQPSEWTNQSTLQLHLLDKGDRTALRFQHEKLADIHQRNQMKEHWRNILQNIKNSID